MTDDTEQMLMLIAVGFAFGVIFGFFLGCMVFRGMM